MVVDGRMWFFGFDYSMDTAVSPLIDDPERMAEFASEHMLQTDGIHDVTYWRDLVDMMGAATAWDDLFFEDEAIQTALTAIGVRERDRDWDCLERCIEAVHSDDAEVSAAATTLMTRYQRFVFELLPVNWPEVFAALRPS